MTRATLASLALTALLSGCIIYETRDTGAPCLGDCSERPADSGVLAPNEAAGPHTDEEAREAGLHLTIAEGQPGQVLFTTLVSPSGLNLLDVRDVAFVGPVTLVDRVDRSNEILMVLEIAEDALPSQVDVFVVWGDDDVVRLQTPFVIVAREHTDTGWPDEGCAGDVGDTAADSAATMDSGIDDCP